MKPYVLQYSKTIALESLLDVVFGDVFDFFLVEPMSESCFE